MKEVKKMSGKKSHQAKEKNIKLSITYRSDWVVLNIVYSF